MSELTEKDRERLDKDFSYHPPAGTQWSCYEGNRDDAKEFAHNLMRRCPPSRELSLALTNLEQCVMWANASIARNESNKPPAA